MKRFYRENLYKSLILWRRKLRPRISNGCPKPQNQTGIKIYPLLIHNIGSQTDEVGLRWEVASNTENVWPQGVERGKMSMAAFSSWSNEMEIFSLGCWLHFLALSLPN